MTQQLFSELSEKEQTAQAMQTVELLYKLNTIAIKCRKSDMGFLGGQKPAVSGGKDAAIKMSEGDDDFVAIIKVDFPNKEIPTQFGETAGTFSWLTNRKYPMRGFAIAETVHTLTLFKRMFRVTLEKLSKHKLKTALMFLFFKTTLQEMVLGMFEGFAAGMDKHLFKEERYCQSVREIRRVLNKMIREDGFLTYEEMPKPTSGPEKRANIARYQSFRPYLDIMESISALLEFDDAYRYRLQWLFTEGTSAKIAKAPIRELRKLFATLLERESDSRLRQQWKVFRLAVFVLAFNPKLMKQVKRFFSQLSDEEMKMSIEDKYHAIAKASFDFGLPPRESYH